MLVEPCGTCDELWHTGLRMHMIAIMQPAYAQLFKGARPVNLAGGETLFRSGDGCLDMFLVREGSIDLIRYSETGHRMRLHTAGAGQIIAEASAYSTRYHCDGITREPVRLQALPIAQFLSRLAGAPDLAQAWAAQLAHGLQRARLLSEIRTLRTVAERLDTWLASGSTVPPKGRVQGLAETLGVSREALYREMAKRRL